MCLCIKCIIISLLNCAIFIKLNFRYDWVLGEQITQINTLTPTLMAFIQMVLTCIYWKQKDKSFYVYAHIVIFPKSLETGKTCWFKNCLSDLFQWPIKTSANSVYYDVTIQCYQLQSYRLHMYLLWILTCSCSVCKGFPSSQVRTDVAKLNLHDYSYMYDMIELILT